MNHFVLLALAATLGTWFVTALGAATVAFFKSPNQKAMNLMLGFASGVMIAASFWSLLQPAIERAETASTLPAYVVATTGFLLGALFMWGSDKIVSFARKNADSIQNQNRERLNRIIMLVLSITLHNIPEGMAVGISFALAAHSGDPSLLPAATALAMGIGIQNFPEGAAISLPLHQEGMGRGKAFLIGAASGVVEPIFALLTVLAAGAIQPLLPWLLSFAAGAMLYVVVEELIPEANLTEGGHTGTLGVMAGFLIMMILDVALG